ncbi:MAG: DUF58 domain-containing protein [Planctomycetaceae bacterium]
MLTLQIPEYMKLLPTAAQAQLARRTFPARGRVEGFKSGSHRSPYLGSSTEFAEHREYSPGDDPRNLDWRVFARQDRYCVKQYVEETNLRATILLDSSASMRYQGDAASSLGGVQLSKFDYAKYIAAMLSFLFVRQGDAVGLIQFDTEVRSQLPARGSAGHLRRVLQALDAAIPENASDAPSALHEAAERIPCRGIVILLSDLLSDTQDLMQALHHLRYQKHEVVVFQILTEEELTFPFRDAVQFRDLEGTVDDIDLDPASMRAEYLRQFTNFLNELKQICRSIPVDYVRLNTKDSYVSALSNYLGRRNGGRR